MLASTWMGKGYVVLNLQSEKTKITEKLCRSLPWPEENRQPLLTWDEMPPYCRYCQKDDHCRADCAELLKTKHCFECNELGHIIRDCPRRNRTAPVAPNKRVAVELVKPRKVSGAPSNKDERLSPPPSPKLTSERSIDIKKKDDADNMKIDDTTGGEGSNKQSRHPDVISGEEIRDPKKFENGHEDSGINLQSVDTDTGLQNGALDDSTKIMNNLDGGRRDSILTTTTTNSLSQND